MAKTPNVKGRWFGGDRTREQQFTGLDRLWSEVADKTVLDVGCAEGDISIECARRGARVYGVEIRADAVTAAQAAASEMRQRGLLPTLPSFDARDVNTYRPMSKYDIVLMLAVLHKLRDPSTTARRYAAVANDLVVIRLPPGGPIIVDERSGKVPHDIGAVMLESGFALEHAGNDGPFGEWMGYYRRTR